MCRSVIDQIDKGLTAKQRLNVEEVEKAMRLWCDTSKGKDQTMCYYMGVGDAESVRATLLPASCCFRAASARIARHVRC